MLSRFFFELRAMIVGLSIAVVVAVVFSILMYVRRPVSTTTGPQYQVRIEGAELEGAELLIFFNGRETRFSNGSNGRFALGGFAGLSYAEFRGSDHMAMVDTNGAERVLTIVEEPTSEKIVVTAVTLDGATMLVTANDRTVRIPKPTEGEFVVPLDHGAVTLQCRMYDGNAVITTPDGIIRGFRVEPAKNKKKRKR